MEDSNETKPGEKDTPTEVQTSSQTNQTSGAQAEEIPADMLGLLHRKPTILRKK